MRQKWLYDLHWMIEQMQWSPRTVCECGVGPLDISIAPSFVGHCQKLILIEPVDEFADQIEKAIGVHVHRVAIGERAGLARFVDQGGSSYLQGTWSPTKGAVNRIVEIPVYTFDMLDDGYIDVLNLDCEGQEWAVLKNMKSRPKLLAIEVFGDNPYQDLINEWLQTNNYTPRFATGPTSENTIYSRP